MKIIVENLSREIVKAHGDNTVLEIAPTCNISVDFIIAVNGEFINSNLTFENEGSISFDEAERIIREKLKGDE